MSIIRTQHSQQRVKRNIKNRFKKLKVKMKTKKSLLRRFKFTGTGKLMSTKACHRHGLRKRSKRSKRTQTGMKVMKPAAAKMILKLIPYKKYIR